MRSECIKMLNKVNDTGGLDHLLKNFVVSKLNINFVYANAKSVSEIYY